MVTLLDNNLDLDTYLELRASVGWKRLKREQAKQAIENSLFTVVAMNDGHAVGMARIVGDAAVVCYVQDLVVRPECHKLGIGKAIMERLIEYVKSIKFEDSEMMMCLMCAKGREKFYEKFGFIQRPTDGLGPGMIQYIGKIR